LKIKDQIAAVDTTLAKLVRRQPVTQRQLEMALRRFRRLARRIIEFEELWKYPGRKDDN